MSDNSIEYTCAIAFIRDNNVNNVISEEIIQYFCLLLKDFGGYLDKNNTNSFIKCYSSENCNSDIISFFNNCKNNKWGRQLKELADSFMMSGPHELKSAIKIER